MEPRSETSLSEQLRRFVRWFFTVSPEAAADPAPLSRQIATKPKRRDVPQLRGHAQQTGRVGVSQRKRP